LQSLSDAETPPSIEQLKKPYLPELDPGLARETETLIATALLTGMDHALNKLDMADAEIPPLPFEEAVAFMKSRVPVTKTEWNALEPKLRFRAFTVARLAQLDYIDTARQVLVKALETGKGTAEAHKQWQAIQTLVRDDALQLRPGYWENVFRTNTQTAYVAGKLMQFQNNPPPAWRLLIIDDARTSDICRGLIREGKDSLTLAADHPFWKTFGFPPYHYQCRTGIQAVYQSQIEHGAQVENPAIETLRGQFKPMRGFGGNPLEKESWWTMTEGMIERAVKYGIDQSVILVAKNMGLADYAKNIFAKTAQASAAVNMGNLSRGMGNDGFVNGMRSKLEQAPEELRNAWNNTAGEFKVIDAHSGKAYYSFKDEGIFFDLERDSRGHVFPIKNEPYKPAHSTAFHELFHNMSHIAAGRSGHSRHSDFTDFFESKKYGKTLSDMLWHEAEERIQAIWDELRNEAVGKGLQKSSVLKNHVYGYLAEEIKALPLYEQDDVSDIWEGVTKGAVRTFFGHGASYWKNTNVGVEAFAEMGKALANHPESLKRIQEYFPKSYEIFLEMLEEIGALSP
jgi:hypothetical protein